MAAKLETAFAAHRQGDLATAERLYRQVLRTQPRSAPALHYLGLALIQRGEIERGAKLIRRAIALRPDDAAAHANLGAALTQRGDVAHAIAALREAVALNPAYAEAHWNLSNALLLAGQFAEGWREFEWRWTGAKAYPLRAFPQPRWTGEDAAGRTVLIHAEGGMGDTLQFVRFAPRVAARGARVVLEVQAPLVRLLRSVEGVAGVWVENAAEADYDLHVPMMSLPLVLGVGENADADTVPYLRPDATAVAAWRTRLAMLPGRRVGLVWAGASRPHVPASHAMDRRRSISLADLAPLAAVAGVSFVSLQKGPPAAQARKPPPGLVIHDYSDELQDFADTAALVAALDLVITVDTSVVHLAGALGVPVWLLNRFDTCWRWLLGRDDSPWYPTLRQFRQAAPGEWDVPIAQLARALARFAGGA